MKLKQSTLLFNALADGTRLRIVNLLTEGELCVCDIMSVLREPQSKVSRHLAYLRRAGLVEARKQGLWMYYRLAKSAMKTLRTVLEALERGRLDAGELEKDVESFRKLRGRLIACCG